MEDADKPGDHKHITTIFRKNGYDILLKVYFLAKGNGFHYLLLKHYIFLKLIFPLWQILKLQREVHFPQCFIYLHKMLIQLPKSTQIYHRLISIHFLIYYMHIVKFPRAFLRIFLKVFHDVQVDVGKVVWNERVTTNSIRGFVND